MAASGRQRLDKWLFFARVVKSRSLAARLAVSGRVRVNRDKASQASDPVRTGDVLTITLDRRILVWKVLDTGMRRGPAPEARTLYEDMSPAPSEAEIPDAQAPLREIGSGRPARKERRITDRPPGRE